MKAKSKTKIIKKIKAKIKPKVAIKKINTKAKKVIKKTTKNKSKPKAKTKVVAKKPTKITKPVLKKAPLKKQPKTSEEYMNKAQLAHLEKILLKWKEELMQEVDRTVHHMQDEAANYPDPVDRASQEEEFNLELRTRDRERKLLKKIEETLARIKDNDYGYCDDCGAEIGIGRLEARPTATQCIECKTIAEIREKQIGDGT